MNATLDKQPDKLESALSVLDSLDEPERVQMLLDFSDHFHEVPESVARRPFPEAHRVPFCESDAYVWVTRAPGDTIKLYFAVENPSGISARALAYLLDRTLSGLKAEEVARISAEIVPRMFRQNISMGKGMGLTAMVQAVQTLARQQSLSTKDTEEHGAPSAATKSQRAR